MRKVGISIIALSSLFAVSAQAADLPARMPVKAAPMMAAPFSWTGFYIGGNVGYGWGDQSVPYWLNGSQDYVDTGTGTGTGPGGGADMTYVPESGGLPPIPSTNCGIACEFSYSYIDSYTSSTEDPSGWFGGAQIGYNYQFSNNVVLGFEADISFGSLKSTSSAAYSTEVFYSQTFPQAEGWAYDYNPYEEGAISVQSKLEYFGTARVRLGYAFDRFLPYLTGGLAWGYNKVTTSGFDASGYTANQTPVQVENPTGYTSYAIRGSESNYHLGWALGAGFEYALDDHWSIKAEYIYADLGSETYGYTSTLFGASSLDLDLTLQTAKVGVNYRF